VKTVFFGTPEFAVPSLRALLGEGFPIGAVVTQPDKPQGRSRSNLLAPPVKQLALEEGIEVLQPERPRTEEFYHALRSLEPDIGVVVAYGHILREDVLRIPTHGMINVHASLLPKLRGAAPIQHALIEGFEESGVTIMQMDAGMDTGPILHQIETDIAQDETFGELHSNLAELGALALVEALTMIGLGRIEPRPQNEAGATYAPKIDRDTAHIVWTRSATQIARIVRAMDPTPGAWTTLDGSTVKLFGPVRSSWPLPDARPGQILASDEGLTVATGEGSLRFLDIQPAGRRRMSASDWLRGRGAEPGHIFE
jgi:methionyl-tRNA formyltransferase